MMTEATFNTFTHAVVCAPGGDFAADVSPDAYRPDPEATLAQYQKYCAALKKCGVSVLALEADPLFPHGCFISDMALITEYLAVIGNFSDNNPRQGEQKNIAAALTGGKFLKFITAPGRLDCSDVLQVSGHFYVSLSDHTNEEGVAQLSFFLREYGYAVTVLDQSGDNFVRLSRAATYLGAGLLLVREELARHFSFLEYEKIIVPHKERGATNALMVNGTLLLPAGHAEILRELKLRGIPVIEVDVSEFEKTGGGLGGLSLRLPKAANNKNIALSASNQSAA